MALDPRTRERQVNVAATLAFLVALAALAALAAPACRWQWFAQFAVTTAAGGSRPGSSPVTMKRVHTPIPTAWSATRS